jgi:hypothetical protein
MSTQYHGCHGTSTNEVTGKQMPIAQLLIPYASAALSSLSWPGTGEARRIFESSNGRAQGQGHILARPSPARRCRVVTTFETLNLNCTMRFLTQCRAPNLSAIFGPEAKQYSTESNFAY